MQNKNLWIGIGIVVLLAVGGWWYTGTREPVADVPVDETAATSSSQGNSSLQAINSDTDVASIVAQLSGTSQFASLFSSTGIRATIVPQTAGKYTVFVPTDGAISQLPAGTIANMTLAEKKRLVQNHVIAGAAIDVEALTAGQRTSLSGDPLNFSFGANGLPMVGNAIIIARYNGTNGTVYLIDNVLIPPQE